MGIYANIHDLTKFTKQTIIVSNDPFVHKITSGFTCAVVVETSLHVFSCFDHKSLTFINSTLFRSQVDFCVGATRGEALERPR